MLNQFSSSTIQLDKERPDSSGDAKCKVFKGKSSAMFYTGFRPVFTGYNGQNGLIRRISVYQCNPANAELLKSFIGGTYNCYEEDFKPTSFCKSLLFVWAPGSTGELLEKGTGIKSLNNDMRRHHLLLQVIYNPGTGFLTDESGIRLYHTRNVLRQAGKMVVGHRSSNKLVILPNVSNWRTLGLCPSACMKEGKINVSSVTLHAGMTAVNVKLSVVNDGIIKPIISGYRSDYQPVRQLQPTVEVDRSRMH